MGGAGAQFAAVVVGPSAALALGLAARLIIRCKSAGLSEVLLEFVRGRMAAAAERERRATMVEVLERLHNGGRLEETDASGRQRAIVVTAVPLRRQGNGGRR